MTRKITRTKRQLGRTLRQPIKEYQIVGRAAPTSKDEKPKIYRMIIFSKNSILAKSMFWRCMKKLNKKKRSGGELLSVNEIFQKGGGGSFPMGKGVCGSGVCVHDNNKLVQRRDANGELIKTKSEKKKELMTVSNDGKKNSSYISNGNGGGHVRNWGLWLRYDSTTGTHNMYKEYRALCKTDAISSMYSEMSGRHRALPSNITILRISVIAPKDCRRDHVTQLHKSKLAFPLPRHLPLRPKHLRSTFTSKVPTIFMK